jgi:outer membrane immunogenic protein
MNLFKTAIIAALCVTAVSTASFAAGKKTSSGTENWAGPYAGLSIGYIQDRSELYNGESYYKAVGSYNPGNTNNIAFGGQAGINWQGGKTVYGFEADAFGIYGETKLGFKNSNNTNAFQGQDLNATASLRARLGMVIEKAPTYLEGSMIYATGGLALLQTTSYHWDNNQYDDSKRLYTGWTLGAGLEKKVSSDASFKLEGRYTNFGAKHWSDASDEPFGANPSTLAITTGINYHF